MEYFNHLLFYVSHKIYTHNQSKEGKQERDKRDMRGLESQFTFYYGDIMEG